MDNLEHLCMGCMKDNGGQQPCPYCGYREDGANTAPYLAPRTIIAERYLIGKKLSSDGEGASYLAYDCTLNAPAVVREYLPEGLAVRHGDKITVSPAEGCAASYNSILISFLEMARTLGRMRELSAVLPVYDVFEDNGTAYYVSEYIESITLEDFLNRNGGRLSFEQARAILMPVLSALCALQNAEFIHRGISTETLLVGRDGKVRLSGFATAALRTSRSDLNACLYPGYSAIEQYGFDGRQGTWTDVYAIAAVFFRVLTGSRPPEAPERVTNDRMPIPAAVAQSLPSNVLTALADGLQFLPDDRTRTVEQFRDMLAVGQTVVRLQNEEIDQPAEKADAPKSPVTAKEEKKKNLMYGLIALICTVVILGIIGTVVVVTLKKDNTSSAASTLSIDTGSSLPPDSTTDYVQQTVPDVSGKTYAEIQSLYGDQYTVQVGGKEYSATVAAGKTVSQSPDPNTTVQRNTQTAEKPVLAITLSMGRSTATVPNLSGKSYEEAYIALVQLGFSPENIQKKEKYSAAVAAGKVVDTTPIAGTTGYSKDAQVVIYVNTRTEDSSVATSSVTSSRSSTTTSSRASSSTPPAPVSSDPGGDTSSEEQ